MENVVHNPCEETYKRKIAEIRECYYGHRGWVRINNRDAVDCGVSAGTLRVIAKAFGLRVYRHGRHGWVCSRSTN